MALIEDYLKELEKGKAQISDLEKRNMKLQHLVNVYEFSQNLDKSIKELEEKLTKAMSDAHYLGAENKPDYTFGWNAIFEAERKRLEEKNARDKKAKNEEARNEWRLAFKRTTALSDEERLAQWAKYEKMFVWPIRKSTPDIEKVIAQKAKDYFSKKINEILNRKNMTPPKTKTVEEINNLNKAVNDFAEEMKQSLAIEAAKGKRGWDTASLNNLLTTLKSKAHHIEPGAKAEAFLEIANYAMFIHTQLIKHKK